MWKDIRGILLALRHVTIKNVSSVQSGGYAITRELLNHNICSIGARSFPRLVFPPPGFSPLGLFPTRFFPRQLT